MNPDPVTAPASRAGVRVAVHAEYATPGRARTVVVAAPSPTARAPMPTPGADQPVSVQRPHVS